MPKSDSLVVIGISGSQLTNKMTLEKAQEDAARKVSMYYGVYAFFEIVEHIGSGFLDFYIDSNTILNYDRELEKFKNRLIFDPERDVTISNGATFVRFTYPAVFPERFQYSSRIGKDGRPEWISQRPNKIGDFYAGVGYAGRHLTWIETVEKSYESAIVSIVSNLSTSIETREVITENQKLTSIESRSEGLLRYFTILEIWIDPDSRGIWTLAIAQSIN